MVLSTISLLAIWLFSVTSSILMIERNLVLLCEKYQTVDPIETNKSLFNALLNHFSSTFYLKLIRSRSRMHWIHRFCLDKHKIYRLFSNLPPLEVYGNLLDDKYSFYFHRCSIRKWSIFLLRIFQHYYLHLCFNEIFIVDF